MIFKRSLFEMVTSSLSSSSRVIHCASRPSNLEMRFLSRRLPSLYRAWLLAIEMPLFPLHSLQLRNIPLPVGPAAHPPCIQICVYICFISTLACSVCEHAVTKCCRNNTAFYHRHTNQKTIASCGELAAMKASSMKCMWLRW